MTSELSKLLHEIKKCRDRDYSFEELCHTISSHSMDSFGSGRLSDEERPDRPNGTLTRVTKVRAEFKCEGCWKTSVYHRNRFRHHLVLDIISRRQHHSTDTVCFEEAVSCTFRTHSSLSSAVGTRLGFVRRVPPRSV